MSSKAKQISLKIAIVIALLVIFFIVNTHIESNRRAAFNVYPDSGGYAYQVEDAQIIGDDFVIKGWFFELKKVRNVERTVTDNAKLGVVLFDLESEVEYDMDGNPKYYEGINTEIFYEDRPDVNDYFRCEYDYSHCGFIAKVKVSDLDLTDGDYRIVFKLDCDKYIGILSETYVHNGELRYVSPDEYYDLDVKGTDLEQIINEGMCIASSKDNEVCVYQLGQRLYWITVDDSFLEKDGSTIIEYQIDTTQFDKLPQKRIDGGSYWDSIGEAFETNEITASMNCGKYRVSVRNIPDSYSITRILTGYYVDNMWIWQKYLRPIYNFSK